MRKKPRALITASRGLFFLRRPTHGEPMTPGH